MTHEEKLIKKIPGLQSAVCKVGGYDINYVVLGGGPPLVLIHGANIGWGQWHQNIGELARHFRVYAIDLPGAGGSTRVNFTEMDPQKTFVDVVADFIIKKNLGRVHLVGHSVGGWVVMKLAIERPGLINKIVLVNSLGFSDFVPWGYRPISFYHGANLLSKTVMLPSRKNLHKFLADVLYNKEGLSEELADYYYEAVNAREEVSHPFILINRLFRPFRIRNEFVMRDYLHQIKSPALVISSDRDPLLPLRKQEAGISLVPHALRKIFKNTGHVPPMERSQEFNNAVINFLRYNKA